MNDGGTRRLRLGRRGMLAMAVVAATAAGSVAWGATPASAVTTSLTQSSTAEDSTNFKPRTVTCPGNLRVYGAGYNIVNGLGKVAVHTVEPSPDLRSVLIEANEVATGITTPWRLDAQAVCGPAIPGLHRVSLTTNDAPVVAKNQDVSCPMGEQIYGAGYGFANGNGKVFLSIIEYNTNFRRVTVAAEVDDNTGLTWSLTAYGICGPPAATHNSRTIVNQVVDSNTPKAETVFCPAGTKVHGLGVRVEDGAPNPSDVLVEDLTVTAALTSVTAKAYENDATGIDWGVRPQAICAS